MRNSTICGVIAVVLLLAGLKGTNAATIEWSTNQVRFIGKDGQNSISLVGTLVEAVSLGLPNAGPNGAVKITNGGKTEEIEFQQRNDVLPSSGFTTAYQLDSGDANWDAVIKSADWCGDPNPTTVTLKKLEAGTRYQIELFVYDERDAAIATRTATFDDGEGNASETIRQDAGVSVIGSFLADGSKQVVNLTQGNATDPTLNAYVLRLVR